MKKLIIGTALALTLTACGGSKTGSFGQHTIIKTYPSDNSGVVVSENIAYSNGTYNAAFLVSDTNNASKIADALYRANNGLLTVTDAESYVDGSYYIVGRGVNAAGEVIELSASGVMLSSDTFVSYNVIEVGSEFGLGTDGSTINGLPVGTFNYNGDVFITGGPFGAAAERGNLNLTANFSTSSASLSALTENKFLAADNLTISQNGKLSGQGIIGATSRSRSNATINGYFAGTNAAGVHGVAAQNADVANGMAAIFIGSR